MKILYDHQIFTTQKYGGISRYFYELIKELNKMDDVETHISLLVSNNHYLSDKNLVKFLNILPNKYFKGKFRIFNLINKPKTILTLKKKQFDVFHPTYYDPYFLKYLEDKPFVLTVYDMIHEKLSDYFSKNDRTTKKKKILVEKSCKIIAISESTKNDLCKIFQVNPEKVSVIHLATSFESINAKAIENLPNKYLLFVGGRGGYKNFNFMINSIADIIKRYNIFLICAGGRKFKKDEIELFYKLGIGKMIIQIPASDSELKFLYQNAIAFIFPSLYEGFGIPVLESFACGCPVVLSNTSSFPEIARDAAIYFDPYDINSIRKSVENLIKNNQLRIQLIQKGFERLKHFSWSKTAFETLQVYKQVLDKNL